LEDPSLLDKIPFVRPEDLIESALKSDCSSIAYTYSEPTIFFEYAYDIAKLAKENKLLNLFVTNGYMSREAIEVIAPYLDGANVDLKFSNETAYKEITGARLRPVLDSIEQLKRQGVWVEVTTLVIPGLNDSDKDLKKIAGYIAEISNDIPWHISRFHPDYNLTDVESTPLERLNRAMELGRQAGLIYVYVGNVAEPSVTLCSGCRRPLIKRGPDYHVDTSLLQGRCSYCAALVPGLF